MSDQTRLEYQIQLGESIDYIQFLLRQGLLFCGHDEPEESKNHFFLLLRRLCNHNKDIEVVTLQNALNNLKLIASDIQKDIVNTIETKIVNAIISEIRDKLFLS